MIDPLDLLQRLEELVKDFEFDREQRKQSATLRRLEAKVDLIARKVGNMATKAEFDAAIAAVNAELDQSQLGVDALEAKIAELQAGINAGGMTAEEEAAALEAVAALQARAAAINADAAEQTPE